MPIHRINSKQLIWAVYKTQIGVGILALPMELAEASGTAGIFSLLISWMIAVAVSYLIVKSMARCPGLSFQQAIARSFGTVGGYAVNASYTLFAFVAGTSVLLSTIYILQTWILKDVPAVELAVIILIPTYMVSRMREQGLGRYAEFVYIITLWLYPLLSPLQDARLLNMLPLFPEGAGAILKGVPVAAASYLGLESALFLLPFAERPEKAFRDLVIANSLTTGLYLVVVLVCFLYFDVDQLKTHLWPTLELFKTVKFPFIERFELVFLPYYLFVIVYTCMMYFFIGARTASFLLRRTEHLWPLRVMVLTVALSTFFFQPDYRTLQLSSQVLTIAGYSVLPFAVFWYVWTYVRRKALSGGKHS